MNLSEQLVAKIKNTDWGANLKALPRFNKSAEAHMDSDQLQNIIKSRLLTALFQPIVNLKNAEIYGHEGLVRGPVTSHLHMPMSLFDEASKHDLTYEIEHLSRQVVLENFATKMSDRKLFLNVSPALLMQANTVHGATLAYIKELGLSPNNVIIELTENTANLNYKILRKATDHYRNMGFEIAIDDLGEGFSGLRLWSELKPDYVKVDKHFITGIDRDDVKKEFVKSMQQIAEKSGSKIVAEGIETIAELKVVLDLNVAFGQGYLLGYQLSDVTEKIPDEIAKLIKKSNLNKNKINGNLNLSRTSIVNLVKHVEPISINTKNEEVYRRFQSVDSLNAIPVIDLNAKPIGLISRYSMLEGLARPYRHELYGKRGCDTFMDREPLIFDKSISLQELSGRITELEPHYWASGFIIAENEKYLGMGSVHNLLREITQLQIQAAKYANPLTLLPGNVPISEHMDGLIKSDISFWACYCDLDNFKPFNDVYGFKRGDELLEYVGQLLKHKITQDEDFVGHIGGDDFVIIFQSANWKEQCEALLNELTSEIPNFYDESHRERGGIEAEDRAGNKTFYPFVSLSIGAVNAISGRYESHHEVSAAMASAKKQAKSLVGNSLFIERRYR